MAHTVMVTGADGFIGSHLTEELVKKGEKVKAFCYYNSFNSCGWIDSLAPEIRSEIEIFMGDIRDPNGVRTAMQGQERVFHLAALIAIPFSYHSPDSYVDTNIKGTLNVLQAARDLGTQRLMVTSTSEVYGTAQYVPIDEKHPYQGQSPYSATKIGADRLAESFYRSFDVPLSIVRPFNTYGPRQSARAVIPTIITQLLAGRTEIRLGSLAPTRDFNYVKDTAAGFMAIADCDAAVGQEINIATGREISIGDLADELIRQINPEARVVCEAERLRPGKSEVERLLGDASKLRALTGWQPAYTFEQGLAQTIEWLRGNMDGYKVDAYNLFYIDKILQICRLQDTTCGRRMEYLWRNLQKNANGFGQSPASAGFADISLCCCAAWGWYITGVWRTRWARACPALPQRRHSSSAAAFPPCIFWCFWPRISSNRTWL